MKTIFVSLVLSVLLFNLAHAGSLYRWVDKEGNVHYGERPAADAVSAEKRRLHGSAENEADLPYSVRKARQDFPVTLYVSPACGEFCIQARALLNKRGIPFAEKNIMTKEDNASFKAVTGGNIVPTLMVGKTSLAGFAATQWNSELDNAGYPTNAAYGFRPTVPAPAKNETPAPETLPETQQ